VLEEDGILKRAAVTVAVAERDDRAAVAGKLRVRALRIFLERLSVNADDEEAITRACFSLMLRETEERSFRSS
jgi:hypothetical protein